MPRFCQQKFRDYLAIIVVARRGFWEASPGTRRAEEERFGSHGGLKAREGTGSEGNGDRGRRKQRLRNDLHPFGGASFNPGGGPFAGRERAGRKAGGIPRRVVRAERPGSGLASDRLARDGRSGDEGSTVQPVAGRFRMNRSAGRAVTGARRGRQRSSRRTEGAADGRLGAECFSSFPGAGPDRKVSFRRSGADRRFLQSAAKVPLWKPGCGGQGAQAPEASGSCPARTRSVGSRSSAPDASFF